MFYIEEMPRSNSSTRYPTEIANIEEIRAWIRQNCDCTIRHVIAETPMGQVVAEGIQETVYFGWDDCYKKPRHAVANRVLTNWRGFSAFKTLAAATEHYQLCKKTAEQQLERKSAIAKEALQALESQGVVLSAYANALDDTGLYSGLQVEHLVDGFYFTKQLS